MDLGLSLLALILAWPVLLACAAAVRLDGGPGVIFRQTRVGLRGGTFVLLKFRTLQPTSAEEADTRWSIADDARLRPLGRFLRRTSLDELPQLWNVVRGDMSLVGPRPERPHFVRQFAEAIPGYDLRHRVPPGVTGRAQVLGLRGDTSIDERARLDNHYIDTWSLRSDLKILLLTARSMVSGTVPASSGPGPATPARLGPAAESRPGPVAEAVAAPARGLARIARALGRRPSWLVAATVLCVCAPSGRRGPGAGQEVQVTVADVASLALVALAALLVVARARTLPARAALAFAAPVAALGITSVAAVDAGASLPGYVRFVQVFVLVPLATLVALRDRYDVSVAGGALVLAGLLEGGLGIHQFVTGTGASFAGRDVRAVGTFGAADVMGMATVAGLALIVTVAFFLTCTARVRWLAAPVAAVLATALALSLSRGCWIAVAVALAVIVVARERWAALRHGLAAGAAAILVIFGLGLGAHTVADRARSITSTADAPDQSVIDRYSLWRTAEGIWRDHPATGVGVKGFAEFRDSYAPMALSSAGDAGDPVNGYRRQPLLSPHNQYLLIASEQGLAGLAGFGGLLAAMLCGLWRDRDRTDPRWVAAAGFMSWLLVNFCYADLGGATTVLVSIGLGLAARAALVRSEARR